MIALKRASATGMLLMAAGSYTAAQGAAFLLRGPCHSVEGSPKALKRVSIQSFSNLFLAAKLRTVEGTQTNQGVLNNFGEASHNEGPPHSSGSSINVMDHCCLLAGPPKKIYPSSGLVALMPLVVAFLNADAQNEAKPQRGLLATHVRAFCAQNPAQA